MRRPRLQRTLKGPVQIDGVGLHSGKQTHLKLEPAKPGTGIVFVRTDLPGAPEIPGTVHQIKATKMATTLSQGAASVSTVEHLLAAFQLLDIDNVVCSLDGPEVPILDGSSIGFCEAISSVGVNSQLKPLPTLVVKRRVEIRVNEKWAVVEPADELEIQASIDWDHPVIGYQEFAYCESKTSFDEVATARTFGFLKDVENLRRLGLAQGGSLDNAIVLTESKVINPDGLRFSDEFVRHKVLDALGDFKLAGFGLRGSFRLHRSGHDLHSQLLAAILSDARNFELVDGTEKSRRPAEDTVPLPVRSYAV